MVHIKGRRDYQMPSKWPFSWPHDRHNSYYDDQKSINIILTENNDWKKMMLKTNNQKGIINGQPLFNL